MTDTAQKKPKKKHHRRMTEKQSLFAKYMFTRGSPTFSNGVQSAAKAGYNGSYGTLGQMAVDNLKNPIILAEKKRIQAKTVKKLDLSRENQQKKLEQALALAIKTKRPAAMVAAIREQNAMLGYHQDNAPNTAKEAAKRATMAAETKKLAQELAYLLTRRTVVNIPLKGSGRPVKAITGEKGVIVHKEASNGDL